MNIGYVFKVTMRVPGYYPVEVRVVTVNPNPSNLPALARMAIEELGMVPHHRGVAIDPVNLEIRKAKMVGRACVEAAVV